VWSCRQGPILQCSKPSTCIRGLDKLGLLKLWVEDTPRAIFPQGSIGFLREGYEAGFLALEGNSLDDWRNILLIKLRFNQGWRCIREIHQAAEFSVLMTWIPSTGLAAAQHALAREYGFESWPALVHHIESMQPDRRMLQPARSTSRRRWTGAVQRD
jgi:hypothetical protein